MTEIGDAASSCLTFARLSKYICSCFFNLIQVQSHAIEDNIPLLKIIIKKVG